MLCCRSVTQASTELSKAVRLEYVASVTSQDSAYFDKYGCGEIADVATGDIKTIRKGFGEDIGWMIWLVCYLVAVRPTSSRCRLRISCGVSQALTVAADSAPKLFLVLFGLIVFTAICLAAIRFFDSKYQAQAHKTNGSSSTFLEQCLAGIRVVQTFSMQRSLLTHWDRQLLTKSERSSKMESLIHSLQGALLQFITKVALGLGYFYGHRLVSAGVDYGHIVTVSWSIYAKVLRLIHL